MGFISLCDRHLPNWDRNNFWRSWCLMIICNMPSPACHMHYKLHRLIQYIGASASVSLLWIEKFSAYSWNWMERLHTSSLYYFISVDLIKLTTYSFEGFRKKKTTALLLWKISQIVLIFTLPSSNYIIIYTFYFLRDFT